VKITLTVNGLEVETDVEPHALLVDLLRGSMGLTGTHIGCDTSQCGACTVLVDGRSVKACAMLAAQAAGRSVTTVEGLARADAPHPMQAAFRSCHGLQCGFCTPGMIIAGIEIVERARREGVALDERFVRRGLDGNVCRCTGYHNIVRAVMAAAEEMGPATPAEETSDG